MRVVPVLMLAGCWSGPAAPTASVPTPAERTGKSSWCPLAMERSQFNYVRHELFPGCTPYQLGTLPYDCVGACPTPCGGALVERPAGSTVKQQIAAWTLGYRSGEYATKQAGNVREVCEFAHGRLVACTTPFGEATRTFERDVKGRITAIPSGDRRVAINYDERGRIASIDDNSDTDGPAAYAFSYDAQDRLTRERRTFDGMVFDTVYTYDRHGDPLLRRTLDDSAAGESNRIELTYESAQLSRMVERGLTFETTITYEYDAQKRPTKIAVVEDEFSGGDVVETKDYDYVFRYQCD